MISGRYSLNRIVTMALGGAVGGLIAFIFLNPFVRGKALFGDGDAAQNWLTAGTVYGAVIGFWIGGCLIAAEEWNTRNFNRILRRSLTGALIGLAGGALGGLDGQFVFQFFQPISVVFARCVGWALMGAGAGICPGLVSGSWKRAELGAFGGLLGGLAGGLLFDGLSLITHSADLSRGLGFVLVGAAVGIIVALLEEIAKEYWIVVLTGAKEGRSYMLSKNESTIGRDETADIPLFGDNSVQRTHARIVKSDAGAYIKAEYPGNFITVNSHQVASVALSNGDIIGIGNHKLRFGSRRSLSVASAAPIQQQQAVSPPANATMLQVISGPHAGATFPLSAASIQVGRAIECAVQLPNDTLASRRHAQIVWDGASWRIEDCGSTNGVYVNGQRISAQAIHPGDEITIGQSAMRVL